MADLCHTRKFAEVDISCKLWPVMPQSLPEVRERFSFSFCLRQNYLLFIAFELNQNSKFSLLKNFEDSGRKRRKKGRKGVWPKINSKRKTVADAEVT